MLTILSSIELKEYGQTIINMLQVISKPHLPIGTLGFSNRYSKRRITMISLFNKKSIISTVTAFSLILLVGCSSTTGTLSDNKTSNTPTTTVSTTNTPTTAVSTSKSTSSTSVVINSPQDNSSKTQIQKSILNNIKNLALQGKIINSTFPVKSTVIEDVEKKLGKPDKTEWIPTAKGTYTTFSKYNVVFGFNKGSQIFEARSFDSQLGQISLSMVKEVFGTPAYDAKSNSEEIIGYTAGKEFKILFVFPRSVKGNSNPMLKHYSVLYPNGTVNSMADDPGRKW
jgi:hypothetical protein